MVSGCVGSLVFFAQIFGPSPFAMAGFVRNVSRIFQDMRMTGYGRGNRVDAERDSRAGTVNFRPRQGFELG
jgi:hypothetical protein